VRSPLGPIEFPDSFGSWPDYRRSLGLLEAVGHESENTTRLSLALKIKAAPTAFFDTILMHR
jgi:hypothetical protein